MHIPQFTRLSPYTMVARRQIYRLCRAWITGVGVYDSQRLLRRTRQDGFYSAWDFQFNDRLREDLSDRLRLEGQIALTAALGRACKDRRININVRMVLARDYMNFRKEALSALATIQGDDHRLQETRNRKVRLAKMRQPGLRRVGKSKKRWEDQNG